MSAGTWCFYEFIELRLPSGNRQKLEPLLSSYTDICQLLNSSCFRSSSKVGCEVQWREMAVGCRCARFHWLRARWKSEKFETTTEDVKCSSIEVLNRSSDAIVSPNSIMLHLKSSLSEECISFCMMFLMTFSGIFSLLRLGSLTLQLRDILLGP